MIFQIPIFGQMKMIPVIFSICTAIIACHMQFSVIFMEGGSGKNGSTIAVSYKIIIKIETLILSRNYRCSNEETTAC